MPWYPGATKRPVDRYQSGRLHVLSKGQRRLVLHTAVSSATSLFPFFNVAGRATPHFYVNDAGEIEQYIDTDYCGTANLNGNHDSICVESSDDAGKRQVWTLEQKRALANLAIWVNKTHGIPLERLLSSKPGSTGIGWHRLGIDGNFPQPPGHILGGRVKDGEIWTLSPGKECPFDGKILGTVRDIIPMAKQGVAPLLGVDEVTPEDLQKFGDIVEAKLAPLEKHIAGARAADAKARDAAAVRDQKIADRIVLLRKAVAKLPKGATSDQIKGMLESLDVDFKVVVDPTATDAHPHEDSN